ncbi:MAG: DUF58 domain-containing protein [Bacteroidia bacterium]|nr:DUF58 domain-containing protein [Bacteroidia bacterium]
MKELIKKVRKLEIKTRRMVEATFAGEYHSAFKGQGLEFDEVRPYQYGDDIRSIDWNVTAKMREPYVKLFREEREQTMFVLFDISGSEDFGGDDSNKLMIGTEIAAVMAFSALKNSDKIGLATFTDKIERFFSPKKGRQHVLALIRGLLQHKAEHRKTNIKAALDFVKKTLKRRSILIIISDFIDKDYGHTLAQLSRKHDLILIRLYNPREILTHSSGFVPIRDAETGKLRWLNSMSSGYRNKLKNNFLQIERDLEDLSKKNKIDFLSINTETDYISDLEKFFRKRNARRSRG